jgi:hypothetical protein
VPAGGREQGWQTAPSRATAGGQVVWAREVRQARGQETEQGPAGLVPPGWGPGRREALRGPVGMAPAGCPARGWGWEPARGRAQARGAVVQVAQAQDRDQDRGQGTERPEPAHGPGEERDPARQPQLVWEAPVGMGLQVCPAPAWEQARAPERGHHRERDRVVWARGGECREVSRATVGERAQGLREHRVVPSPDTRAPEASQAPGREREQGRATRQALGPEAEAALWGRAAPAAPAAQGRGRAAWVREAPDQGVPARAVRGLVFRPASAGSRPRAARAGRILTAPSRAARATGRPQRRAAGTTHREAAVVPQGQPARAGPAPRMALALPERGMGDRLRRIKAAVSTRVPEPCRADRPALQGPRVPARPAGARRRPGRRVSRGHSARRARKGNPPRPEPTRGPGHPDQAGPGRPRRETAFPARQEPRPPRQEPRPPSRRRGLLARRLRTAVPPAQPGRPARPELLPRDQMPGLGEVCLP